MKVLLSLIILCIMMTLSDGACLTELPKLGAKGCLDPYDKTKHPPASKWKSNKCMDCTCNPKSELSCCTRHAFAAVPGCKPTLDVKTCTLKFYKIDDPSEPCPNF